MSGLRRRVRLVVALGGMLLAGPAVAGMCDGISPVSGTANITAIRVFSGLQRPVLIIAPPGDTDRTFIVEQDGLIHLVKRGILLSTPFLDVSAIIRSPANNGGHNEEGLLSLAFHPDYATNGYFFIFYTDTSGNNNVVRLSRSGNPDVADPSSSSSVYFMLHTPFGNHNGGMIAFSPVDGYLYISTGDGGGFCDTGDNSQDGSSNLGKIIRLDVDLLPATIPTDNPFVGNGSVLDEIWALGLRNPWRFSFDRLNGDLYIGDVGQDEWEEINYQAATSTGGENYGWDTFEGAGCKNESCSTTPTCASLPGAIDPIAEYSHSLGCSVSGGFVYRGCRLPDLEGTYFYADFCSDIIFSFEVAGGVAVNADVWNSRLDPPGGPTINNITGFGEDARGEVYIADRGGEVFKIVPTLDSMEVSGEGALPLRLTPAIWSWENVEFTSTHPIASYRVYRHDGNGSGAFDCVQQTASPVWLGGDPAIPATSEVFSYVVTARNSAGAETDPGKGTGGTPRQLSAVACPS